MTSFFFFQTPKAILAPRTAVLLGYINVSVSIDFTSLSFLQKDGLATALRRLSVSRETEEREGQAQRNGGRRRDLGQIGKRDKLPYSVFRLMYGIPFHVW